MEDVEDARTTSFPFNPAHTEPPTPGPEDPTRALIAARGMSRDEVDRRTCHYAGRWWMVSPCPGCGGWLGVLRDSQPTDPVTWICVPSSRATQGGEGRCRVTLLRHLFQASRRSGLLLDLVLRCDPNQLRDLGAVEFGPVPLQRRRGGCVP